MRTHETVLLPGLKAFTEGRNISYIAKQIQTDQGGLNRLVSCKRGASLAMALSLAKYFHTTVEKLVEEPKPTPVKIV